MHKPTNTTCGSKPSPEVKSTPKNQSTLVDALCREVRFGDIEMKVADGVIERFPAPRLIYLMKPFCRGHPPPGQNIPDHERLNALIKDIQHLSGEWLVTVKVAHSKIESWKRERVGSFTLPQGV